MTGNCNKITKDYFESVEKSRPTKRQAIVAAILMAVIPVITFFIIYSFAEIYWSLAGAIVVAVVVDRLTFRCRWRLPHV
jgi:hypothetical protein